MVSRGGGISGVDDLGILTSGSKGRMSTDDFESGKVVEENLWKYLRMEIQMATSST